jgi:hypothetical protein
VFSSRIDPCPPDGESGIITGAISDAVGRSWQFIPQSPRHMPPESPSHWRRAQVVIGGIAGTCCVADLNDSKLPPVSKLNAWIVSFLPILPEKGCSPEKPNQHQGQESTFQGQHFRGHVFREAFIVLRRRRIGTRRSLRGRTVIGMARAQELASAPSYLNVEGDRFFPRQWERHMQIKAFVTSRKSVTIGGIRG